MRVTADGALAVSVLSDLYSFPMYSCGSASVNWFNIVFVCLPSPGAHVLPTDRR